jgi:hypothetical protein
VSIAEIQAWTSESDAEDRVGGGTVVETVGCANIEGPPTIDESNQLGLSMGGVEESGIDDEIIFAVVDGDWRRELISCNTGLGKIGVVALRVSLGVVNVSTYSPGVIDCVGKGASTGALAGAVASIIGAIAGRRGSTDVALGAWVPEDFKIDLEDKVERECLSLVYSVVWS